MSDLPDSVVERCARAAVIAGARAQGYPDPEMVWRMHAADAKEMRLLMERAALQELVRIIDERAGEEWGISTRVALGTETARMAGVTSIADLLQDSVPPCK